ncbi:MAG: 30S ribosomal protein S8 [bacterium]|nr:30S ribosomal protein S8 [bacterium]
MTMTDPIADMLTRIRNANRARKESVDIPASKLKLAITRVLKSEGYIDDFKVVEMEPRGFVRIFLKYARGGEPVLRGLRRVSSPGRRTYVGVGRIPRPYRGLGVALLSTPRGIMTDRQARAERAGGEVICWVW